MRILRSIVVLITALTFAACTTLQTVPPSGRAVATELDPGDEVTVFLKDGSSVALTLHSIKATGISGIDAADGRVRTFAYGSIEHIEHRHFSWWKASAWTLGVVLAVLIAGYSQMSFSMSP